MLSPLCLEGGGRTATCSVAPGGHPVCAGGCRVGVLWGDLGRIVPVLSVSSSLSFWGPLPGLSPTALGLARGRVAPCTKAPAPQKAATRAVMPGRGLWGCSNQGGQTGVPRRTPPPSKLCCGARRGAPGQDPGWVPGMAAGRAVAQARCGDSRGFSALPGKLDLVPVEHGWGERPRISSGFMAAPRLWW